MQNVLLRYCLEEDLIAVVRAREHYFDITTPFRSAMVDAEWHEDFAREGIYDVFAMHARFNGDEIR